MPEIIMELIPENELVLDLNENRIDPYLVIEDITVVEPPRTVDTEMSDTSENPVQNKVIKKYVDNSGKSDKNYVHTQMVASAIWDITHSLGKYPSVTIVDSGNSVVVGDVDYIDTNTLRITFSSMFSGKAYCN